MKEGISNVQSHGSLAQNSGIETMKQPAGTNRIVGLRERKPCKILYYEVWFGDVLITYTYNKYEWDGTGAVLKPIK